MAILCDTSFELFELCITSVACPGKHKTSDFSKLQGCQKRFSSSLFNPGGKKATSLKLRAKNLPDSGYEQP
jgi:hypothetical protein